MNEIKRVYEQYPMIEFNPLILGIYHYRRNINTLYSMCIVDAYCNGSVEGVT